MSTKASSTASAWEQALRTHQRFLLMIGGAAIVIVAIVAAVVAGRRGAAPEPAAVNASESAEPVVTLTADKLASANLHIAACEMRELREMRTVPGKIAYNEARHLELKAPVAGVVKQVFVSHEQPVKQGDRLVTLTSREIGLARDEVAKFNSDLEIAQKQAERARQVDANLVELLAALEAHPDPAAAAESFSKKLLGEYREAVFSAYSRLVLAEAVAAQTRPLEENGAISGRIAEERRSNRQVAAAEFETVCEQSKFAASQARDKSLANVQQAQRQLAISCQRLESLGGSCSEIIDIPAGALSELDLRAPYDAVVEDRLINDAAQVAVGQSLFMLADTSTVWVSAEIHERDWSALKTASKSELIVRAPGLNQELTAQVKFTEGVISPETRSVTLVGELENGEERLRPGMIVWVSVAVAPPRRALAVPASAVVRHEQLPFVFVQEKPGTFRRVDVKLGLETPDWVEITDGLEEGQSVVDRGAFVLKSELLLEHEAE